MSKRLKFFDVKTKKSFTTTNYKIKMIKGKGGKRKAAVATAPSGIKAFRFLPM